MRAPRALLDDRWLIHSAHAHVRDLASGGRVGPVGDLPLAGLVGDSIADLELHREKACRRRSRRLSRTRQRRLSVAGLVALLLGACLRQASVLQRAPRALHAYCTFRSRRPGGRVEAVFWLQGPSVIFPCPPRSPRCLRSRGLVADLAALKIVLEPPSMRDRLDSGRNGSRAWGPASRHAKTLCERAP